MKKTKEARIIAKEVTKDGASYRIEWPCGMKLWFDITGNSVDGYTGDWNKYIFSTTSDQDMEEKAFQEAHNDDAGAYNFATAIELAIEAYEKE